MRRQFTCEGNLHNETTYMAEIIYVQRTKVFNVAKGWQRGKSIRLGDIDLRSVSTGTVWSLRPVLECDFGWKLWLTQADLLGDGVLSIFRRMQNPLACGQRGQKTYTSSFWNPPESKYIRRISSLETRVWGTKSVRFRIENNILGLACLCNSQVASGLFFLIYDGQVRCVVSLTKLVNTQSLISKINNRINLIGVQTQEFTRLHVFFRLRTQVRASSE